MHLPLLVHAALHGDHRPAIPLAVATALLFLGLDIIDDLDGDLTAEWEPFRPAEVNLAAATRLCSLPQLAIASIEAPPSCIALLQKTVAQWLLRMAAGQHQDLFATGAAVFHPDDVEQSVAAKSGEELALFSLLAAQLAGTSAENATFYSEFGRALGTATQLASDCHDLFAAQTSRDLANGTRTLPIALHLQRREEGERAPFLALLAKAGSDEAIRESVRQRLREAGELRRCAVIVEVYCQRSLQMMKCANPLEPAAGALRAMVNQSSFFRECHCGASPHLHSPPPEKSGHHFATRHALCKPVPDHTMALFAGKSACLRVQSRHRQCGLRPRPVSGAGRHGYRLRHEASARDLSGRRA